jgi:hypothetical protein
LDAMGVPATREVMCCMTITMTYATPAELRVVGTGSLVIDAGRTLSFLVNVVARPSTGDSAKPCGG